MYSMVRVRATVAVLRVSWESKEDLKTLNLDVVFFCVFHRQLLFLGRADIKSLISDHFSVKLKMENSYITRYNYQYVANRGVNTDRYNRKLTRVGNC